MASARNLDIAARLYPDLTVPLDRLPYTAAFDSIYERFCQLSGGQHTKHDVWWYFVDVRKRGLGRSTRRRRRSQSE